MATTSGKSVDGIVREGRLVERGPGFRRGVRDLPSSLNLSTLGTALVAAIFGCTGPALIIINGANEAGLSANEVASWIFGVYAIGGLISFMTALYYKQPIVGAWSIPGAVLVVDALGSYTLSELAGAYLISGVMIILVGLTRVVRRVMSWLPFPIIMAMIAGALIQFAIDVVESSQAAPLIVAAAVVGYLLLTRFVHKVPGVVGALVLGCAAAASTGAFSGVKNGVELAGPSLVVPSFSVGAVLAVSVPLAMLVIGAENAQAMGVLMSEGYRPPANSMTLISGLGGMVTAVFGGHNANVAGPMTAICTSPDAGPRPGRYAASVVNGVMFGLFGLIASVAVVAIATLPSELVAAVAGLAMIRVLLSAFQGAFRSGQFQIGAFFALVIATSGVELFGISGPFWALVGGVSVSLLIETEHFKSRAEQSTQERVQKAESNP